MKGKYKKYGKWAVKERMAKNGKTVGKNIKKINTKDDNLSEKRWLCKPSINNHKRVQFMALP